MRGPELHSYESPEVLFDAAAAAVAGALAEGVTLVCSGGTTPEPLYRRLAQAPLPWDRIAVTLSDERWVAPDSPDSNEALVRRALPQARLTPLRTEAPTPEAALPALDAAVAALPRPFAVTVLGMGADLHTASLFPGAEGLEAALDRDRPALVAALRPAEAAGSTRRVSLTLRALLDSRLIVLLLKGADKRAALERALGPGPLAEAPVRGVLLQDRVPVHIYWAP
jgi:6-phosphogluconolactonase